MKTLVKPHPHSTIAISTNRLMPVKIVRKQKIHFRDNKKIISYLLLFISFPIFIFLSESPKLAETICASYNSEVACNVW
tara:strand:+ start:1352 stop:1588 length:237 start_codon:yes stop_codon:yes gene_type:complete